MQEIDDNIILKKQQEFDTIRKQEDLQVKLERSAKDNLQVIKDIKGAESEKNEESVAFSFSHEDSSENLIIGTLINNNLHASDDGDIGNLQDLWQAKIEVDKSGDSINSTSGSSSSNGHAQLSQNSIYLKEVLSKPLILALCEIVAKKPADPVEYLGHWLLHYKICEKRGALQRQKERELELKQVDVCEEVVFAEDEEDQNYLDNYVALKI